MSGWFKRTCSSEVLLRDLKSPLFWRDVFLELVAATILLTSIMCVLITNDLNEYKLNTTHIGLSATLLVFVIVETFHPVNRTNINPAISIPLFIGGRVTLTRALAYTTMQCLAAPVAAGFGYLYFMTPEPQRQNYTALKPPETMTLTQSIAMETFFTFVLLFVIMSLFDKSNHSHGNAMESEHKLPGLVIGSVIGLGVLLAGTHTKGLMNPIVPLAPSIVTGDFRGHAIYWIGPMAGGTLGALFYNLMAFIKNRFSPKPSMSREYSLENNEKGGFDGGPHIVQGLLKGSKSSLKSPDN